MSTIHHIHLSRRSSPILFISLALLLSHTQCMVWRSERKNAIDRDRDRHNKWNSVSSCYGFSRQHHHHHCHPRLPQITAAAAAAAASTRNDYNSKKKLGKTSFILVGYFFFFISHTTLHALSNEKSTNNNFWASDAFSAKLFAEEISAWHIHKDIDSFYSIFLIFGWFVYVFAKWTR